MKQSEAIAWIAEIFEEPRENVEAHTSRSEIAGWDSLGTLALMAALDEKFDIQVSDTDVAKFARVGDVLELLRAKGALEG